MSDAKNLPAKTLGCAAPEERFKNPQKSREDDAKTASSVRVPFNPVFRDANKSRARYRLLCGSAGSGKSFNTAQDFMIRLADPRFKGANLMVVRKTETSARTSAFAEMCGAVKRVYGDRAGEFYRVSESQMTLTARETGNCVIFRGVSGAAALERVKSVSFPEGKLTWIWIEEATELDERDLDVLDDRLRGELSTLNPELYYQITMTFNPVSSSHWIKRRFFDAPPSEDVFISKSVFGDNRFIDSDFARRMERRREYDPEGYRVYALGEWGGAKEGLILPHYKVEALRREDFDVVWYSQDFGFNHADCILEAAQRDGALCVLREIYVREKDTGEIIALANGAGFDKNAPMYCDSAEPDRIKTWRSAGYRAMGVRKSPGSVAAQIEWLKSHKLVFDPGCVNTIREASEWRWQRDTASGEYLDVPTCVNDDAMAALRYATEGLRRAGMRTVDISALGL